MSHFEISRYIRPSSWALRRGMAAGVREWIQELSAASSGALPLAAFTLDYYPVLAYGSVSIKVTVRLDTGATLTDPMPNLVLRWADNPSPLSTSECDYLERHTLQNDGEGTDASGNPCAVAYVMVESACKMAYLSLELDGNVAGSAGNYALVIQTFCSNVAG